MLQTVQTIPFSISMVQDEVRALVNQGIVDRHQRIYTLCKYFPSRDWLMIEQILESDDYLLRDYINDLLGREDWLND